MKLEWNVYCENFNARKIEVRNIFNHGSFYEETMKLLKKKDLTFEDFSEELRRKAQYYYWSKSEYEIVITSLFPRITEGELNRLYHEEKMFRHTPKLEIVEKIDIYDQLRLNWDVFCRYVWSFRKVKEK